MQLIGRSSSLRL